MNSPAPCSYTAISDLLDRRLSEAAPARVQILTGPRQVGKTHLLRGLVERFGELGIYGAADSPEAALAGWWELQWRQAERLASPGAPALLVIDEIHYLRDWSRKLKAEYDALLARNAPVHVVVSGSSSLRLGRGARESMAGRFERLELLHWPASELSAQFDISNEDAVEMLVRLGSYPGAFPFTADHDRWRSYVRQAIVEPAIGVDIMATEDVRRPALLREVFSVAAGHPAEIVSLQKLRAGLMDPGALATIAHYLQLLEQAYLVAPLQKLAQNATRRRASPPKLVVLNQGILGALSAGTQDTDVRHPATWGRWVENACIAHAWNAGQDVKYWRAEPFEVDMVTSGTWGDWAVEVKTSDYGTAHLAGLLECCKHFPHLRPLLLCERGDEALARRAGITVQPWRDFLLSGPPD